MAKKAAPETKAPKPAAKPATPAKAVVTPVRQTPVPKAKAPAAVKPGKSASRVAPTHDQIARRAYELYASGVPGSEADHWFLAERDLNGTA